MIDRPERIPALDKWLDEHQREEINIADVWQAAYRQGQVDALESFANNIPDWMDFDLSIPTFQSELRRTAQELGRNHDRRKQIGNQPHMIASKVDDAIDATDYEEGK